LDWDDRLGDDGFRLFVLEGKSEGVAVWRYGIRRDEVLVA
jgi:hypothetical protein